VAERRERRAWEPLDDQQIVRGGDQSWHANPRRSRGELAIDRDLACEVPRPHRVRPEQPLRDDLHLAELADQELRLSRTPRRESCDEPRAQHRAALRETAVAGWNHRADRFYRLAVGADEIRSMLVQLQAHPDDVELRRRAAEALDADGQRDDAIAVLAPLINLTGHDDDTQLPCLCKKCLPTSSVTAEAGGFAFHRSFAVVGRRVLHFWQLAEQEPERENVRASVAAALRRRLAFQKEARR
jgi:hypothetical protein